MNSITVSEASLGHQHCRSAQLSTCRELRRSDLVQQPGTDQRQRESTSALLFCHHHCRRAQLSTCRELLDARRHGVTWCNSRALALDGRRNQAARLATGYWLLAGVLVIARGWRTGPVSDLSKFLDPVGLLVFSKMRNSNESIFPRQTEIR